MKEVCNKKPFEFKKIQVNVSLVPLSEFYKWNFWALKKNLKFDNNMFTSNFFHIYFS